MGEISQAGLIRRRAVAEAAVRAGGAPSLRIVPGKLASQLPARPLAAGNSAIERRSIDRLESTIQTAFPAEPIIGRHSTTPDRLAASFDNCWLIDGAFDQSDGDSFPALGPSVAYLIDGWPVVAAVYVRDFDEVFVAVRGLGATLGGKPISVADAQSKDSSIVIAPPPHGRLPNIPELLSRLSGWRSPGPDATPLAAMCYIATGRIDGFVAPRSMRFSPWDLAAGMLIVEEAGGMLAGHQERLDVGAAGLTCASNESLLQEIAGITTLRSR